MLLQFYTDEEHTNDTNQLDITHAEPIKKNEIRLKGKSSEPHELPAKQSESCTVVTVVRVSLNSCSASKEEINYGNIDVVDLCSSPTRELEIIALDEEDGNNVHTTPFNEVFSVHSGSQMNHSASHFALHSLSSHRNLTRSKTALLCQIQPLKLRSRQAQTAVVQIQQTLCPGNINRRQHSAPSSVLPAIPSIAQSPSMCSSGLRNVRFPMLHSNIVVKRRRKW